MSKSSTNDAVHTAKKAPQSSSVLNSSFLGSGINLNAHLQTKKEFQDRMMKERQSGIHSQIEIEQIWGLSAAFENIDQIYDIKSKEIGSGHFGSVRTGKLRIDSRRTYAIKTIKKSMLKNDLHLLKRELEILREVDNPYIAKFYECYQDEKAYHFVLEYCEGEVLVDRIIN